MAGATSVIPVGQQNERNDMLETVSSESKREYFFKHLPKVNPELIAAAPTWVTYLSQFLLSNLCHLSCSAMNDLNAQICNTQLITLSWNCPGAQLHDDERFFQADGERDPSPNAHKWQCALPSLLTACPLRAMPAPWCITGWVCPHPQEQGLVA